MEFKNRDPKIFVISGKAGSGKNVIASMISDIYYKKNKRSIVISYSQALKNYASKILDMEITEENKPREFLQHLGVELIKNNIDDNFLINRVIGDIKVYSYFYDVIIVSDARFISEIECLNIFNNVTSIHVNSTLDNNLTDEEKMHSTETGLDNYNSYNYVIENDKTIYKLREEVERIIKEVSCE